VPPEEMEQPDLAIPLPEVMTPDATPIPLKKEVEKKRVVVEQKQVAPAKEHRDAQERHRIGVAGGRGAGSLSQAGYKALLAAAIHRHVPSSSSSARDRRLATSMCRPRAHDGHQLLGFVGRARFVTT